MIIKIGEKTFENNSWEMVDSIDHFACQEFIYFTENLYKTETDEFVLETKFQLNPEWHKDELKTGILTDNDLLPKTEYKLISYEEADAWLDGAVWEP